MNGSEGRGEAWGKLVAASSSTHARMHTHTRTHRTLGQGEQRQLPLLGAAGRLPSVKGQTLDLHVAISCQVVDGLQVKAVGELE